MRENCTPGSAWGDEFKKPSRLGEGTGAKASATARLRKDYRFKARLYHPVRHVDGANLSAHSIRAIRGRHHLSLQKRRRGASIIECACRSFCGLQADLASREDKDRLLQGCKPARRFSEPVVRLSRFHIPSKEDRLARAYPCARLHARGESGCTEVHEPDNPALGASSSQRQVPARTGCNVQSVHPRLDKLLWPILSHAVASDPDEDRCLCHPLGASQIQAAPPSDQRRQRLVCPATPRHSNALRPLAAMLWQRPNIGSRVNREVHARFWERAEVKFLRATRHSRWFCRFADMSVIVTSLQL